MSKKKLKKHILVSSWINEVSLFWFLIVLVVALMCVYVYSVNKTIMLVAERDSVESTVSTLRSDITTLETSYLADGKKITMDLVHSLGYGEAKRVVYIPIKSVSVLPKTSTIQ